jgi:hypothetical protein
MARRKKKSEGSLDSLLDTMTNVVGILVIVLVITKLGVSDAVRRIQANLPDISVAQLEEMQTDAASTASALAAIQLRKEDLAKPLDEKQLDQIYEEIEKQKLAVAALEKQPIDMVATTKQIDQAKKSIQQLDAQSKSLAKQSADALALLQTASTKAPPAAKNVFLPNPRAAPKDAVAEYFICKKGKVIHVPLEGLARLTESRIRRLKTKPNAKGEVDCTAFIAAFNRADQTTGHRQFKLTARATNGYLYLYIATRGDLGESADQLLESTSDFSRQTRAISRRKAYIRYLVWSDSFDAYLAARATSQKAKVAAGWYPYYPTYEWRIRMPGNLKCLPAEQPPKPPVVAPKPPVKPKPVIPPPVVPPKKVPNDDID